MKEDSIGQQRLLSGYEVDAHHHHHRDTHSPSIGHTTAEGPEEMDTTKAEIRKSNKPVMEKRRRARINNCLNDLKGILLEAMRKDPARHSKLEKADILELTVRHLQNVQRNQLAIAMSSDPTVLHRFKNGFSECATEVSRYLGRLDIRDPGIKTRVASHLTGCVNGLQQVNPTVPGFGVPPRNPQPPPQVVPHITFGNSSNPIGLLPPGHPPSGTGTSPGDPNNNNKVPTQPFTSPLPIPLPHAFTSVPGGGLFIISPTSTTGSSETLNTSLGSDSSSLSFSSDKGHNLSPIDFSINKTLSAPSCPIQGHAVGQVRVVKVEPLGKRSHSTPSIRVDKGHMWRPW